MNGLFLDDERNVEDVTWMQYNTNIKWVIVRTFVDFMNFVKYNDIDVISFDHDIQDFDGDDEYTGYDCLKFLIDMCIDNDVQLPECVFHTQNPIGKKNMQCYYESAKTFIGEI